jgi:hypothetical protein
MIIEDMNPENFVIWHDTPNDNPKSVLGVPQNRIVEIPDFVDADTAKNMIDYFESKGSNWGHIAFYGSSGMGLADGDPELAKFDLEPSFFEKLRFKFQDAVTTVFDREVKANTSHAQKWMVGGFASAHSDNSDFDGKPSSFQINKYVGILYLNGDYEGGNLFFRDHDIEFKPTPYSFITFPGGIENVHGVTEITEGTRYTMVSFWDFAESEYSEELQAEWEEELKVVRAEQELQREQWDKGNKFG